MAFFFHVQLTKTNKITDRQFFKQYCAKGSNFVVKQKSCVLLWESTY